MKDNNKTLYNSKKDIGLKFYILIDFDIILSIHLSIDVHSYQMNMVQIKTITFNPNIILLLSFYLSYKLIRFCLFVKVLLTTTDYIIELKFFINLSHFTGPYPTRLGD